MRRESALVEVEAGAPVLSVPILSVIVPARDEERLIVDCLRSLTAQSEPGWVLGEHWELIVVDDESSDQTMDRTIALAREIAGVRALPARSPLPKGWTGKCNACWTGAEAARGQWLLFTDADTLHQTGSLSRSVVEAERYAAVMLSYSPLWRSAGVLAQAVLPLLFSELSSAYPPEQVNNPERRIAFATGEFLLVRADTYRALGGHGAVASSLIEDVDLAFLFKRNKAGLRSRYAPEMVEARVGSGFGAVWAGWTRKLALLIHNALPLALWRLLDIALLWGLLLLALLYPVPLPWERVVLWLLWLRNAWRVYRRAGRSHFAPADLLLSMVLGLPLFAALLYASWYRTRILRRVRWKGREYPIAGRS